MHQTKWFSYTALIALFSLTLAACDSNGSNGDDDDPSFASFTFEVTGDASASMDGFAFFGEAEDPETGQDVFVIYFSESQDIDAQGRWGYLGRNSGRPSAGTYSIADLNQEDGDIPTEDFVMVASIGGSATSAITYVSQSGSLTIDESSSNRMEGSFELQAMGIDLATGEELDVTIEGSFDAVGSDDVFVPFAM